jgi:hypothetical protein
MKYLGMCLTLCVLANGQEAGSGLDLRGTVSGSAFYSHLLTEEPRDGSPMSGGVRSILYPTWKISSHWSVLGAVQIASRPYFTEQFETQGYGVKGDLLQLNLGYSRFWNNRSLQVRVGQMSTAFGAFGQRYDPADNPLIGIPPSYGYYGSGVSLLGLLGAEADATLGKFDARAQFVNSSPANRRSIFDKDQYGNWAGGVGYTIKQGFRVGGSFYYGPYLDRQYRFYFPGEAKPKELPAIAYGVDVQWGRGPWNAWGEWQHFKMTYERIPDFNRHVGYGEVRRVLTPRWYAAARLGYANDQYSGTTGYYEIGGGFRPNRYQLLKFSYQIQHSREYQGTLGNVAAVELVTSFHAFSLARN